MRSQLELYFPPTTPKIMVIQDRSIYNPDIPVENAILQITPPGFKHSIPFNVEPGFSLVVNSNLLKLSNVKKLDDLCDIPDGVYIIKYSICPNDEMYEEYYHLRISKIMSDFIEKSCSLDLADCSNEQNNSYTIKQLKELNTIETYIKAAKNSVEDCNDLKKGQELYDFAKKKIDKINKTCGEC